MIQQARWWTSVPRGLWASKPGQTSREDTESESDGCSLLLPLKLLQVELELLALEHVPVEAAGLAWARRDACKKTAGGELVGHLLVEGAGLAALGELSLQVSASLSAFTSFIRFFKLLLVELNVVLLEVPLSEGGGIDVDNGVLDEGLGANELVVGGVVDNINNTRLECDGLGVPGPRAVVGTESSALDVSASSAHKDGLLLTELGHGWDSAHLELSLFLVNWHAASSGPPLLPGVPRNA